MTVHILKCYPFAEEDEWNRFLIEPLGVEEHSTPDFSRVEERAIYVMLGVHGLNHVPEDFLRRLRQTQCKGLIHLGDEFLSGGYELYQHFDFVIRPYYASALCSEGIKAIPLGYPKGIADSGPVPPASQRPLAWSFLGNVNAARRAMMSEFKAVRPQQIHVYDTRQRPGGGLDRAEYKEILRSSVFVPCPMGNVLLETRRVYEALELGAIPLASRRGLMPYYDLIMPGHPIPTFKSWAAARRFAEELLQNPDALDALQGKLVAWWAAYKKALQSEVCQFVNDGFRGAFRSSLNSWRPPTGLGLQAWRVTELLKHHDSTAIKGRCEIVLKRLYERTGLAGRKAA